MAAEGGSPGGKGGSSSTTSAITRLEVIDPHLVLMMRDVMEATDSSPRLNVGSRAGGGGGGGGSTDDPNLDGADGNDGQPDSGGYTAIPIALLKSPSAEGGEGGQGRNVSPFRGGGGGGGGGGHGGIIVLITSSSSYGTTNVSGGTGGAGGSAMGYSSIYEGDPGEDGPDGKVYHIRV